MVSTGLTPERRAEIEDRAERICAALRFDVDGTHGAEIIAPGVTVMSVNNDLQALMSMLDDSERERDLLAETARRLTAERDRLASTLDAMREAIDAARTAAAPEEER